MKTLTQIFEEILNTSWFATIGGRQQLNREKALKKLIQAVKARDKEVLGENRSLHYKDDRDWKTFDTEASPRNDERAKIKQRMEESL